MTTVTARRSAAPAGDDWRYQLGNGAFAVGLTDAGLFWVSLRRDTAGETLASCAGAINAVVPLDEIRGRLVGRLTKDEYEHVSRLGWPVDPAVLEQIGGCGQGWVHREGLLLYDPAAHSAVTPAASGDVQLIARGRLFSIWTAVTKSPPDHIFDPRFFANAISGGLSLHDRISCTCLHDPVRPLHLELVVDVIDHRARLAVVKVLHQATIERALPAAPAPLPAHPGGADAPAAPPRGPSGKFQPRNPAAA